jgi:hypothetical protein
VSKPTSRPVIHISATSGDKRAICGAKVENVATVAQRHAASHRYPSPRCAQCFTAAGLAWMLDIGATQAELPGMAT